MHRAVLTLILVFTSASAMGSGFQVTAHGARALGMGLAFTAVADDATAIYFNPAGLAFQQRGEWVFGPTIASNLEGTYESATTSEDQVTAVVGLPELYYTRKQGAMTLGFGTYVPFGLPMRWENPETFSGRHVAYNANLRTVNVNPTVAFSLGDSMGVGFGIDWVHSKISLERYQVATLPTGARRNVARAKLESDLLDTSGWGWNAGFLWRAEPWSLGVSYRSAIDLDHEPTLVTTQIPTGIAPIDAAVASQLPPSPTPANVSLELPATLNLGFAYRRNDTTVSFDADRTDWSSFDTLFIEVPAKTAVSLTRHNNWEDTWAWRIGVETGCGRITCRAGYYRDETPQPDADVGPILADADRHGFTVGIGIPARANGRWSMDIGYVLVRFDDRTSSASTFDMLAGTWKTTGNELAINFVRR